MRLLITSGATREPIDGVRFISNVSTGKTGAALADFLAEAGFHVTYLRGEGAAEPAHPRIGRGDLLGFTDFESLNASLKRELGRTKYFAVIHLAAVSDYSVRSIKVGDRSFPPGGVPKIDSGEDLGIVLKRNFKLVDRIRDYALEGNGSTPWVVAFKLTNSADGEAARRATEKVAANGTVDAVVHNDLKQMKSESGAHRFDFFRSRSGELSPPKTCSGTDELGIALVEWFGELSEERAI